jgi:putative endonuclease
METTAIQLGKKGESLVVAHLEKTGYTVLATNYRSRRGEVDVIATKGEVIAFVEVKTRKKAYFPIAQVVTYPKQQRIASAAFDFVRKEAIHNRVLRFDIVTIEYTDGRKELRHIPNAFQYNGPCRP